MRFAASRARGRQHCRARRLVRDRAARPPSAPSPALAAALASTGTGPPHARHLPGLRGPLPSAQPLPGEQDRPRWRPARLWVALGPDPDGSGCGRSPLLRAVGQREPSVTARRTDPGPPLAAGGLRPASRAPGQLSKTFHEGSLLCLPSSRGSGGGRARGAHLLVVLMTSSPCTPRGSCRSERADCGRRRPGGGPAAPREPGLRLSRARSRRTDSGTRSVCLARRGHTSGERTHEGPVTSGACARVYTGPGAPPPGSAQRRPAETSSAGPTTR